MSSAGVCRFMKRARPLLLAAPLGWWCVRWTNPPDATPQPTRSAPSPDFQTDDLAKTTPGFWTPAWNGMTADPSWLHRLRDAFNNRTDRDGAIRGLMQTGLPRGRKIGTLLELLPELESAERRTALDLLGAFHPIEASARLAALLRETRDPELAVKLLQTLRAATLITSTSGRIDFDDPRLSKAFELIQKTFGDELSSAGDEPDRFREAVAAIPDVFPGDEAMARFQSLADSLAAARDAGRTFPLTETELYGRWLECQAGAVDGRDFRNVTAFIRDHPQAVADEGTKARVLDRLWITPIRADEMAAVAPLIEQLEPNEAPDDSFVRWLDVKSRLTGTGAIDYAALLRSASPMRKAALIHFGDADPRQVLDRNATEILRRELADAAARLPGSEARDFLESAAAAISGD